MGRFSSSRPVSTPRASAGAGQARLRRIAANGSSLSTRGSAGSPSTRSAMMLRMISSVPPASRMPGAASHADWGAVLGIHGGAGRSLQLDPEGGHLLPEGAADELVNGVLRARCLPSREGGEGAVRGVAKPRRSHVKVGNARAHRGVLDRLAPRAVRLPREPHEILGTESRHAARSDGRALVHQDRDRDPPPAADVSQPVLVGYPNTVEEHVVEPRSAVHLADGPHFDAGRAHVDDEAGEPLVLGHVRVGPDDDHPPPAEVGAGIPGLLSVDDPVRAVASRPGQESGDVGPGPGLAEELAPDFVAAGHLREMAPLLLVGSVCHQAWTEHPDPDREDIDRGPETKLLLSPDHLLHGSESPAAVLLRPGEACPAVVELERLPVPGAAHGHRVVADERPGRRLPGLEELGVAVEKRPRAGAETRFGRRVVEVHVPSVLLRTGSAASRYPAAAGSVRGLAPGAESASRQSTSRSRHSPIGPRARARFWARR